MHAYTHTHPHIKEHGIMAEQSSQKKQGTVLKASVTALYLTYESEETLCSLLKDGTHYFLKYSYSAHNIPSEAST